MWLDHLLSKETPKIFAGLKVWVWLVCGVFLLVTGPWCGWCELITNRWKHFPHSFGAGSFWVGWVGAHYWVYFQHLVHAGRGFVWCVCWGFGLLGWCVLLLGACWLGGWVVGELYSGCFVSLFFV